MRRTGCAATSTPRPTLRRGRSRRRPRSPERRVCQSESALSHYVATCHKRLYNPSRLAPQLRTRSRLPAPRRSGGSGLHLPQQRARAPPSEPRQAGALRVRAPLRGHAELPLRDQLLPDRDALHPVRHRGRVSLSGRGEAERLRVVRARGDRGVRGAAARGVRLRVAKGGARVEVIRQRVDNPGDLRVRQLRARQMLRGELEGEDLQRYVEERVATTTLERAQNWARSNACWPLGFGLACCAIEMITTLAGPRTDLSRFGAEVTRASPRQADMIILSGRISVKMAPVIRRIYDQMLEPKWVISMGACASSAGMFNNYALVAGADKFLPVDVYI